MTGQHVHALTNLASGHAFELTVPDGSDVLGAAEHFLAEQGLGHEAGDGFYISVRPIRHAEEDQPALGGAFPASAGADDQSYDSVPSEQAPSAANDTYSPAADDTHSPAADDTYSPAVAPSAESTHVAPSAESTDVAPSAESTDVAPSPEPTDPAPSADPGESSARGSLANALAAGPMKWSDGSGDEVSGAAEDHDQMAEDEDTRDYERAPRHGIGGLLPEGEHRTDSADRLS